MMAQSAVDAYNLSQTELRGTARFMSMGGAFTALGGDLSTLNQNPAGIGVYRRSEIGATLDISPRTISTQSPEARYDMSRTKAYCNNFGYVGTIRLSGDMRTFSWGVSYNRIASFDRSYNSYNGSTATSLSNYIAGYTNSDESALNFGSNYNPYRDSNEDWLSILAYNTFLINPVGNKQYQGLYENGVTQGDSYSEIRETGYVDEYAIDFGGNVNDCVYWGLGFGITDLSYTLNALYSESMQDAQVPTASGQVVRGNAGFELGNWRAISGSGWNFKAGVILKPVQQLRIGLAVHTPTWYSLSQEGKATLDYSYLNPNAAETSDNPYTGSEYTDDYYYNFRMNAPWKFMAGVAGVIGNSAIVSLDYERQAYGDMTVSYQDNWGSYTKDDYVTDDIKNYFKATDIIRVGLEYRLTSNFSARAGYNHSTTNVKSDAANDQLEIYTSGMYPSYVFNKDTNAYSLGLGYRYKAVYLDAAYVHTRKSATFHAYTSFADVQAPQTDYTQKTNSIVLSLGFKF